MPNPNITRSSVQPRRPAHLFRNSSRTSSISRSSLAEASLAKDLEQEAQDGIGSDAPTEEGSNSDLQTLENVTSHPQVSMVESYIQPSLAAAGSRAQLGTGALERSALPSKRERLQARREERSLLEDNKVIKSRVSRESLGSRLSRQVFESGSHQPLQEDEEGDTGVTETVPLLKSQAQTENVDQKWEEAVLQGRIHTTWQRETKVLAKSSAPLIATFILQYSLTVASIFTVGHLGKVELGAVSLASMTANITGYAAYYGLATSLDTLCAQAYGSGKKKLVGLQLQRMVFFLWLVTVPIGIAWCCADLLLKKIVPEQDVAILAGQYLKIVLIGAPAFACFESVKRYLQAQGLFSASLYVLLVCAPLNALFNWMFVWVFKWGYAGAPIAVALTDNLLCIGILIYACFVAGSDCWPGFTKRGKGSGHFLGRSLILASFH